MLPFSRYQDLLAMIENVAHDASAGFLHDEISDIAVKSRGDGTAATFISAESHFTEQAGAAAAVELTDKLETEHQDYVILCRGPSGLNGRRGTMAHPQVSVCNRPPVSHCTYTTAASLTRFPIEVRNRKLSD